MSKFRIRVHGGAYGNWYKIQERFLLAFWLDRGKYIDTYQEAATIVENMKESDK